jgi:hypothetical protein
LNSNVPDEAAGSGSDQEEISRDPDEICFCKEPTS